MAAYPIPNRVPLPTMRPNPQAMLAQGQPMAQPGGAFPQAPAQPPQRRGFMDMASQNPEFFLSLGAGLLGGRTGREQWSGGLAGAAQALGTAKEKKDAKAKENATLKWLQSNAPEYADAVAQGVLSAGDAYKMTLEAKKPLKPDFISAGDGRIFDKNSREFITAPGADGPDFDTESKLRKEYNQLDNSQNYTKVRDSFERVRASAIRAATDTTGASDMALVFNYMKMLDPGSTVREGEFAAAAQSGGYGPRIQNIVQNIANGKILTPEQRMEFVSTAEKLYGETLGNLNDTNERYRSIAEANKVDPSRVLIEGEQYEPLQLGQTKQVTTSDGKPATIKRIR